MSRTGKKKAFTQKKRKLRSKGGLVAVRAGDRRVGTRFECCTRRLKKKKNTKNDGGIGWEKMGLWGGNGPSKPGEKKDYDERWERPW